MTHPMQVHLFPGARAVARAPAPRSGRRHVARRRPLLPALLLAVLAAGCGGPGGGSDGNAFEPPSRAEAPMPLELRLEIPERVRPGEPVPMRLVLANRGDAPVEVELGGSPIAFDLVVTAPDGAEVWRRLRGRPVEAILQLRTVEPGGEIDFADRWDQRDDRGRPVEPGSYRVHGVLPVPGSPEGWWTEARTLTIQR